MAAGGATEAAFAPKGNLQLIPNSYQMSRGGLSIASVLVPKTTAADGKSFGSNTFAEVGQLAVIPDGEGYTGLDMWRMLFGLSAGDQLTFPQIYGDGLAQEMYGNGVIDSTRYTDFCAPRIVLKSSVTDPIVFTLDETTGADAVQLITSAMKQWVDYDATWYPEEYVLQHLTAEYGGNGHTVSLEAGYNQAFAINNDDWLRAIGCIRSHKNAETGKWEYSTSYMVCVWADGDRGSDSDYFGFTLQNAIETYLNTYVTDAEGNFLQRGGDSDIVPESFT